MKEHSFFRTIGHFLASLLCLALVAVLSATCVYLSLTRLAKPKGVSEIMEHTIRTTDYTQIVIEHMDIPPTVTIDREKLTQEQTEAVELLLENQAVRDIIDLYSADIASALKGEETPPQLTPQAIKEIARDNIDEVLEQTEENLGQPINKKGIKKQVLRIVDHNAKTWVEVLPSATEVTTYMKKTGVAPTVYKTLDPAPLRMMTIGCLAVALLLLLCQWRGWNWLLFLGISSGVSAGLVGLSILFFRSDLLPNIQLQIAKELTPLVLSAYASLQRNLLLCIAALLAAALVCFALFALTHRFCVKNTTTKTSKGGAAGEPQAADS